MRNPFVQITTMCLLSGLTFSACAPRYTYQDLVVAKPLRSGEVLNTRVSSAMEDWRNSGVQIKASETYTISAKGRWRTYGTCNFTKPDGIGLYKAWCDNTPLLPPVIKGYSHSMLVAKIDEFGAPFAVGTEFEFTAQESGILYFRINDALGASFDNEGYATVTIKSISPASKTSVTKVKTNQLSVQRKKITQPSKIHQAFNVNSKSTVSAERVPHSTMRRTALVIGNADYTYGPLKNPLNDAKAMAASLKNLGFTVALHLNVNQQQIEQAIDVFGRQLLIGQNVALFYYAGHGVQVDGENFLIPTEAVIQRQSDVRYKAVNIGQVLDTMGDAKHNLNIVILDACRDNPLPRSFRTSRRGLARVEGPKGTIIGFATSPGSVASDGEGENGVYTKHFLKHMHTAGLTIEQLFKKVLQGVNEETGSLQTPWTESSFTGNFSFVAK